MAPRRLLLPGGLSAAQHTFSDPLADGHGGATVLKEVLSVGEITKCLPLFPHVSELMRQTQIYGNADYIAIV